MLDVLIVLLREMAEVLLIISALIIGLLKADRRACLPMVVYGSGAGAVLSVALFIEWPAGVSSGKNAAMLTICASLLVGVVVTELVGSATAIRRRTSNVLGAWMERTALPAIVFGFAAFIVLRESMEVMFFLRVIAAWEAPFDIWMGCALAGMAAVGLGVLWVSRKETRRGFLVAFQLSSLALVFLTIQALVAGAAQLLGSYGGGQGSWAAAMARMLGDPVWRGVLCASFVSVVFFQLLARWRKELSMPRRDFDM